MTIDLNIAYFYKNQLNLYGDNGNVEVLEYRSRARGIDVHVSYINPGDIVDSAFLNNINIMFMGGGPDSEQKSIYKDLLLNKGPYIKEFIENGGVGLFICGSYQLMGSYYKAADGTIIEGLGVFDLYTEHFGVTKPRCIGNTHAKLSTDLKSVSKYLNEYSGEIVGFENHGGRTYLGSNIKPFATMLKGHGNNSEDKTEGAVYKNAIGTYFHGPLLARNPHVADFFISRSLGDLELEDLDDRILIKAFTASKLLKQ